MREPYGGGQGTGLARGDRGGGDSAATAEAEEPPVCSMVSRHYCCEAP